MERTRLKCLPIAFQINATDKTIVNPWQFLLDSPCDHDARQPTNERLHHPHNDCPGGGYDDQHQADKSQGWLQRRRDVQQYHREKDGDE